MKILLNFYLLLFVPKTSLMKSISYFQKPTNQRHFKEKCRTDLGMIVFIILCLSVCMCIQVRVCVYVCYLCLINQLPPPNTSNKRQINFEDELCRSHRNRKTFHQLVFYTFKCHNFYLIVTKLGILISIRFKFPKQYSKTI